MRKLSPYISWVALLSLLIAVPSRATDGGAFTLRAVPDLNYTQELALKDDTGAAMFQVDGSTEPYSVKTAALRSLLLPGLGQQYLGQKGTAIMFYAFEAAIWASFITFRVQGVQREEGYQDYAGQFAGVQGSDHSDDYWALLTEWDTSNEYEYQIKSEGRIEFFPDGNAGQLEQYYLENRIDDFEPWLWPSSDTRLFYQSQRAASKNSYRRSMYTLALLAFNRVASSFFAIKSARDLNAVQEEQTGFRVDFTPEPYAVDAFRTNVSFTGRF